MGRRAKPRILCKRGLSHFSNSKFLDIDRFITELLCEPVKMDGSSHASYQLHKTATADQWIQKNGAQYHEAFGNAVKIVTPQPNPQVQFSNEYVDHKL